MSAADEAISDTAVAGSPPPSEFRFGIAFKASLTALFRNFGFVFPVMLTLMLVALVVGFGMELAFLPEGPPAEMLGWQFLIHLSARTLCSGLLSPIVIYAMVRSLQGQHATPGTAIAQGLKAAIRCLLTNLLVILGLLLGLVLLVIPGVVWALGSFVALPVCVIEGAGPVRSLSRSWALTRGHRLTLLGLLLATGAIAAVVVQIAWTVLNAADAALPDLLLLWAIAELAVQAFVGSLVMAMASGTYVLLVAAESGRVTEGSAALPA
ncbi:hypothetical protein GXW71_28495 [Roseomonas hellenica]|uniref:DUF7847 domain-containing protein n=1 Tax=Plastoroseomonas hellenica TaxID=2687306 RepID=A0ABS5F722_9PROT|nr:hypothetical protein [Plastoroseomonas hellenica]MBR0668326.1 hypothetical protein [Plastoroseomonas hellenica]